MCRLRNESFSQRHCSLSSLLLACSSSPSRFSFALCNPSDESMMHIFSFLPVLALCRIAQVCKKFKGIAEDDRLWEKICQASVPSTQLRGKRETLSHKIVNIKWKEQCRNYYEGYQDVNLFPNVTVRGWRRPNR